MTRYESTAVEGTDLEPRSRRALGEFMTTLDDVGRARDAEDLFVVVSQSGSEYVVDARERTCACRDFEKRGPIECKHLRRVAFATGAAVVPAWRLDDSDAVDDQLGDHVHGCGPRVATHPTGAAATDGGHIVDADNAAADDGEDDRPDDCSCTGHEPEGGLCCWPCWKEGHNSPNPDARGDDDAGEDGQ